MPTEVCLLTIKQVSARTSLHRARIYERMLAGTFPKSHRLGERTIRWRSDDIDEWIEKVTGRSEAT